MIMENFEQILQLIFHPIVLALDAISIFIIYQINPIKK